MANRVEGLMMHCIRNRCSKWSFQTSIYSCNDNKEYNNSNMKQGTIWILYGSRVRKSRIELLIVTGMKY
jgi:hypothetical protein